MKPEIEAAIIGAVAGIVGAILGGIIGAIAAWRAASSTNKIQKQIADDNAQLQRQLAQSNLVFQKKLADDTARAQRRATLEAMILKLSEFAIEYPTLQKRRLLRSLSQLPR